MFCTMIWSGHKFQPKIRLKQDARADGLSIHGMFLFESSVSENLVYLKQFLKAALFSRTISGVRDLFTNLRACARYLVPLMWRYVVDNRIFVPSTAKINLQAQCEQVPMRESRITLDPSSRGASGLPRVVLDWRLRGDEVEALRDFALRCDRALRAAGLARLEISEALRSADPGFLDTLRDTNHQAGGACMAESADEGVVDRDLRVFGTENLYVAGAAAFPTSSGANTTFTALAFAERLVDHLSARHALD
jgi:choline dehydrogenase-like flavoprotein